MIGFWFLVVNIVLLLNCPASMSDNSPAAGDNGATAPLTNNHDRHVNTLFGFALPFDVLSTLLGLIVIIGGLIGYFKAGSTVSLISGLLFGILILIGAYLSSRDATNVYLLLVTCLVLAGLMGWRFYQGRKFMPAGLVTILSGLMVIRYIYILIANRS